MLHVSVPKIAEHTQLTNRWKVPSQLTSTAAPTVVGNMQPLQTCAKLGRKSQRPLTSERGNIDDHLLVVEACSFATSRSDGSNVSMSDAY